MTQAVRATVSGGEAELAFQVRLAKLPTPSREFPFAAPFGRDWRFDFAWPVSSLAVEVEGAVHRIRGRFKGDLEKYLMAALLGWQVLRFSPAMIKAGLALDVLEELLVPATGSGRTVVDVLAKHGIARRAAR